MTCCLTGSREQAYVYALSSAAITHAVSRACSIGATTKCGCGRLPNEPPPGDFKWGGCGDDLRFGLAYADLFTSPGGKRKSKSKRHLVNGHNNAAGRKVGIFSLLLINANCGCYNGISMIHHLRQCRNIGCCVKGPGKGSEQLQELVELYVT